MEKKREGGCECGALRYEISGAPKSAVICHCRDCQRQSGSAFGASMVFAKERFALLSGELAYFERAAQSGRTMRGYFCPRCGTRIFHAKDDSPGLVILKPGTLDDPSGFAPVRQLWASREQSWLSLPGLPSFERQPG